MLKTKLQFLLDSMCKDCGCRNAQFNIVNALASDGLGKNISLALEAHVAIAEKPTSFEAKIGQLLLTTPNKRFTESHRFATNTADTVALLNRLESLSPLHCVAVCILNPNENDTTFEHRFILVKNEDGAVYAVQAFNRPELGVTIKPFMVQISSLKDVVECVTTLANRSSAVEDKRNAYTKLCFSEKATLEPMLSSVDWQKAQAKFVAASFPIGLQLIELFALQMRAEKTK